MKKIVVCIMVLPFFACGSYPSASGPAWVDSTDSVYSRAHYVAAVGTASNRTMAESNALANLAAIFGQSIQVDQRIANTYREAVINGAANWTDTTEMEEVVKRSASLDTLVGAEIREVWFDSRSTYYAVAVMEKARTALLYTDMIRANQNMIANLLSMNQEEKNSLQGFSRYQFAAVVADINVSYGNLLRAIDVAPPGELTRGDNYRLKAQNITGAIPIGIVVTGDRAGRIQGAFADAFSNLGFMSGGTNSRYRLVAHATLTPEDYPNSRYKYMRIELDARLTDSQYETVLLPYNLNIKEGGTTLPQAEDRVYTTVEKKIAEEYATLVNSRLLPQRR